jgi:hypothetical protein
LENDPWLLLSPEHVDAEGELAADAATMFDDPDGSPREK